MHRFFIFILIGLGFVSCRIEPESSDSREYLYIVTTTGILQDVVSEVVGDSADVNAIMGPGTDPHIYKPTPGDIEMLDNADVIIANGLHLEGKMAEMLDKYSKEKPVIFIADGLDKSSLIALDESGNTFDPHIWFDPELWMEGLSYVTAELSLLDTSHREYFTSNLEVYKKKVMKIDQEIAEMIGSIPAEYRVLITSHDAFSYFGRRYQLDVRGIQGVSTLDEVGLGEIAEMVDFVIERKIKSIFIETSTSDKTARSILDGCNDRGYEVLLDGPLFSDALGEPDEEGGTYIGMIRENARVITEGLK